MKWIILSLIVWFLQGNQDATYRSQERTITALRSDARRSLRREALAAQADEESATHVRSIGKLLALHGEIVRHSTFAEGQILPATRALLQSRLVRVARRIERREKQRQHVGPEDAIRPGANSIQPPTLLGHGVNFLAQQFGGIGGGGIGGGGIAAAGPAAGGVAGGGAAGAGTVTGQLPDYGPLLAEIIRQVIDPASWEESGGGGTVVYYAPLRVMVVRATTEVHEDMTVLLEDLRAAGGP